MKVRKKDGRRGAVELKSLPVNTRFRQTVFLDEYIKIEPANTVEIIGKTGFERYKIPALDVSLGRVTMFLPNAMVFVIGEEEPEHIYNLELSEEETNILASTFGAMAPLSGKCGSFAKDIYNKLVYELGKKYTKVCRLTPTPQIEDFK
jgi:hypothetical protein